MKSLLTMLVLGCATMLGAQTADPATDPSQTSSSKPADTPAEETATPATVWKADGRPANSALARTVGTPSSGPSLQSLYQSLTTTLNFTQNIGTRSGNLTNQDSGMSTGFSGGIRASKRFGRANVFSANYDGGYSYFYDTTQNERVFHSALVSQDFVAGNFRIGFHDQMRYTPEAGFGFEPTAGDSESFDPGVTPTDSILSTFGRRISNSVSSEIGYRISPSNSVSASATWGMFRFLDKLGGFESDQTNASFSFDHRFSPKQSVYLTYGYGFIEYLGNVPGIDFHNFSLGIARQLPGRLSLQASAGPEYRRQGILGGSSRDTWSWSANSSLSYEARRNLNMGLSFSRSTSNGAGFTPGTTQNRFETNATIKLRRIYSNSFRFGFSHNDGLGTSSLNTDSLYGGYDLSRNLGKNLSVRIGYFAQQQSSTQGCTATLCQFDGLRQGAIIGLRYSFHPLDVFERR